MTASLADIQQSFLAAIRSGDGDALLPQLASERGIARETGFSIYRNAYSSRLTEALENDHPVLGAYLGDALWAQMCEGFLHAYPSRVRSLRQFGDALPEYLRETEPFSESPQIAEIAEFERHLLDRFDAPDQLSTDWQTLLSIPDTGWPVLRLRFDAAVFRFAAEWNGVEIWQALKDGERPPALVSGRNDWLLWRDAERVTRFRSMSADEAIAFEQFANGAGMAEVCEALQQLHAPEQVPARVIAILREWADQGLVHQWNTTVSV
jgi:hypothetical protein